MWVVIKYKTNEFENLKNSLSKNLGEIPEFYFPKIKYSRYIYNKLKTYNRNILGNYLFCKHNKFKDSKKINLIRLRVHERVKELVILRLKIMSREKELISKTYFHLLLPQNFKIASRCLYKAVDQIWFVAGDNSTDFNFYSKRAILASIYSMVMLHYVNNNSLDQTIELLNKQLKRVSKIPKIKNRLGDITKTISQIFKLVKNIRPIKQ